MSANIQVLIAARGGATAKSRCASYLGCQERQELAKFMLVDLLAATSSAQKVESTWVISPTLELIDIAQALGCHTIKQEGLGLNQAFARAIEAVGETSRMLLPCDLPWLSGKDIDAAIRRLDDYQVVVAPSRDSGTSGLLLREETSLSPCFGALSCASHLSAARAAGYSTSIHCSEGFARDIDFGEDLLELAESNSTTTTAKYIRKSIRLLEHKI